MTQIRGEQRVVPEKGARVEVEPPAWFMATTRARADVRIGAFTYIRGVTMLANCARIGRYCSIATGVRIGEPGHPTSWLSSSPFQYKPAHFGWHPSADRCEAVDPDAAGGPGFRGAPARIGHDVWIADHALVRHGVSIGDGAVIAAGAVVVDDVAPYTIVGGVPARPIRRRFDPEVIAELVDLAWWRFSPNQLSGIRFDDVPSALPELRRRIEGGLEPYEPDPVTIAPAPRPVVSGPVTSGPIVSGPAMSRRGRRRR